MARLLSFHNGVMNPHLLTQTHTHTHPSRRMPGRLKREIAPISSHLYITRTLQLLRFLCGNHEIVCVQDWKWLSYISNTLKLYSLLNMDFFSLSKVGTFPFCLVQTCSSTCPLWFEALVPIWLQSACLFSRGHSWFSRLVWVIARRAMDVLCQAQIA